VPDTAVKQAQSPNKLHTQKNDQSGFEFSQMKLNRSRSLENSLEDDPSIENGRYGIRFQNDQRLGKESSESKRLQSYGNKIWSKFSTGDVHHRFFKPTRDVN
jgi:hypothetical protein